MPRADSGIRKSPAASATRDEITFLDRIRELRGRSYCYLLTPSTRARSIVLRGSSSSVLLPPPDAMALTGSSSIGSRTLKLCIIPSLFTIAAQREGMIIGSFDALLLSTDSLSFRNSSERVYRAVQFIVRAMEQVTGTSRAISATEPDELHTGCLVVSISVIYDRQKP